MNDQGERKATIVHGIPGRVRVRLDSSLRTPEFMGLLAESLSQMEGVRHVQINPVTGSLLLLYDPTRLSLEQLYGAATAANITLAFPAEAGERPFTGEPTGTAQGINSFIGRLDRALFDFTDGKLDLRTLFPLGLATAALRQIATSGGNVAAAPWYVLLWYSFESFTRYNSSKPGERRETRASGSPGNRSS